MTRSLVFGFVLAVWSMALAAPPVIAQTTVVPGVKNPGSGGDITELIQDRNFVTVAAGGVVSGLHHNEFLIAIGAIEDVTATDGGQTIWVGGEQANPYGIFYRNGDMPTTFILGEPSQSTDLEECLIFDINGTTLEARPSDSSTDTEIQPVFVTSYSVNASGIDIEVTDGKIIATDTDTGFKRVTGVEFSDGTPVDAATINAALVVYDGAPVPVGPGGARELRVAGPDDSTTVGPSDRPRQIVVVGSKIKEVLKEEGIRGGELDDVFLVDGRGSDANSDVPLPLDGGGGDDVYVVRSAVGDATDLKITVRAGDEDVVVLADFTPGFETLSLGDGRFEFNVNTVDGFVVKQVIIFVDETGAPVSSGGVPPLTIQGVEIPS